jgi:hypothetical protein
MRLSVRLTPLHLLRQVAILDGVRPPCRPLLPPMRWRAIRQQSSQPRTLAADPAMEIGSGFFGITCSNTCAVLAGGGNTCAATCSNTCAVLVGGGNIRINWSRADVIGLFSNNVVSFSRNVVLRARYSHLMWFRNRGCLSVRAVYVLRPLHLGVPLIYAQEL